MHTMGTPYVTRPVAEEKEQAVNMAKVTCSAEAEGG